MSNNISFFLKSNTQRVLKKNFKNFKEKIVDIYERKCKKMAKNNSHNFPHISNEEGKKQSLKSKKLEIEGYLIKYKKYKLKLECFDSLTVLNQNIVKEKETLLSYVSYIDKVLNLIGSQSKEFIEHEYLNEKYDAYWWVSKYSKQTYTKLRHYAINEFLLYVK